jgi:hypothetical protein
MSETARWSNARSIAFLVCAVVASSCASGTDTGRDFAVGDGSADGVAGSSGSGGDGGAGGSGGVLPDDFGEPCDQSADCTTGLCVEGVDGTVCSTTCTDTCPEGHECLPYEGPGASGDDVCMPSLARLCRPCLTDADCDREGVTSDPSRCVSRGDAGSFCAVPCTDGACPETYTCEDVDMGAGPSEKLCKPSNDRECECHPSWADKGLQTSCTLSNANGSCTGTRVCEAAGLSDCSAATPAAEVCDGADNDCNAAIDDGACDDGIPCTDDVCDGTGGCENVVQSGMCRIDGACVTVGDVNPGDPCELCAPEQSQTDWSINTGACNDGDACTSGDMCTDGICSGTLMQDSYEPNDTSSTPAGLSDASDCDDFPTGTISGTLYGPGDEDWFSYHDSDDFLCSIYPRVRLTVPTGANHDLCVYVACDDDSTPSVSCTAGTTSSDYGMNGCCSLSGGSGQENVRLDHDCDATDDSGTLHVRVFNAGVSTCDAYQLEVGDD